VHLKIFKVSKINAKTEQSSVKKAANDKQPFTYRPTIYYYFLNKERRKNTNINTHTLLLN